MMPGTLNVVSLNWQLHPGSSIQVGWQDMGTRLKVIVNVLCKRCTVYNSRKSGTVKLKGLSKGMQL